MSKKTMITASLALVAAAVAALLYVRGAYVPQAEAADIVVYKDPQCGCCDNWVEHLRSSGFTVAARNETRMARIKAARGVPMQHASCHTADIAGYVIEGHVPADTIRRLLRERPRVSGIAAPGMPMGSPGMEGPHADRYNVVRFGPDGHIGVYERR